MYSCYFGLIALNIGLLQEIKNALDRNKRLMNDYIESLRYIYPIFHGDIVGEK